MTRPGTDIRSAAEATARQHGWYVHPCGRPTADHGHEPAQYPDDCAECAKDKRAKAPWPGWKWAERNTRDPAIIREHWPCGPAGANYGIGAKRSGLVILDLDRRKPGYVLPEAWREEPGIEDGASVLAALCERHGQPWPVTRWVRTPSGGDHLYFAAPEGRPIGNSPLGPMIDVRGGGTSNGGYVLGPGSMVGGRLYEVAADCPPAPLPGWLADLLDPPAGPGLEPPRRMRGLPQGDLYGRMRGIVDRLANARPGDGRNSLLHWSACRFAEMVADGEIDPASAENALYLAAEANGHVAKHGERATRATIASGMRRAAA